MIPEGQQLFADGVEVKVGDTFSAYARVIGKWTRFMSAGSPMRQPKAYGFEIIDEPPPNGVHVTFAMSDTQETSEGAELPPLTEAELAEIEARRAAHEIEIRGCLCTICVPNLATLFKEASEDAGRLLTDLRRAHVRIAELEAQICDAVDHGELSPNSERRGLLNKRAAERGEASE